MVDLHGSGVWGWTSSKKNPVSVVRCGMARSTNRRRFGEGESWVSGDALFKGRVKVASEEGGGYRSSSESSELEENVRDGVGEMLRGLFGDGWDAAASSLYTSSAWDLMAKNAVFMSASRGL